MLDFGFWELVTVLLVALLVVGPDRLPGLARNVGLWIGKARRFVGDIKSEIDQELASEELEKALDRPFDEVHEIIEETKQVASEVNQQLNEPKVSASKTPP